MTGFSRLLEPPRLRALGGVPFGLSPLIVVIVLAVLLVVQVAYELARHEAHTV